MKQKSKQAVQTRLAKIAGQISAVSRMVDDDRYCIDVIRQVRAAKAALSSLEQVMLREHVDTCVTHALTGDDVALRKERVEELVAVLGGTKK
jgi:DNA-binding FrmR family transcriptional regulator